MSGTYGGTVTVPTQKGQAFAVAFDGVWIPANYTPDDGFTSENDFRHKPEIRDIGGNLQALLYGGKFTAAKGKLKIPYAQASDVQALTCFSTISMCAVAADGTLGAAASWMLVEDPEIEGNREYVELTISAITEPGITPA